MVKKIPKTNNEDLLEKVKIQWPFSGGYHWVTSPSSKATLSSWPTTSKLKKSSI